MNVEQEHERIRRLADEYQAKLSREVMELENKTIIEKAQSLYEMQEKIRQAKLIQDRELSNMRFEDYYSSLTPLSKPNPVRLVKANCHTLWVTWDKITSHPVTKQPIENPDAVTYFLYMQTGFQNILLGDRVNVVILLDKKKNKKKRRLEVKVDESTMFFNDNLNRYPGEITKVYRDGYFDVLYDDGHNEKRVPRCRLKLFETSIDSNNSVIDDNRTTNSENLTFNTSFISTSEMSKSVRQRLEFKMNNKQKRLEYLQILKNKIDKVENEDLIMYNKFIESSKSVRSIRNKKEASDDNSTTSTNMLSRNNSNNGFDDFFNSFTHDLIEDNEVKHRPTVPKPSDEWRLVYIGPDTSYICAGLVSEDALYKEPNISIPVSFMLQSHGVDDPSYERSQFSDKIIFFTKSPIANDPYNNSINQPLSPGNTTVNTNDTPSDNIESNKGISRIKKDIIRAVIHGQKTIQIEKNNNFYISQGLSDDYT